MIERVSGVNTAPDIFEAGFMDAVTYSFSFY